MFAALLQNSAKYCELKGSFDLEWVKEISVTKVTAPIQLCITKNKVILNKVLKMYQ